MANKANLKHADDTKATLTYEQFRTAVLVADQRMPVDIAVCNGTDQQLYNYWCDGWSVWDAHYQLGYQRVCPAADRNY